MTHIAPAVPTQVHTPPPRRPPRMALADVHVRIPAELLAALDARLALLPLKSTRTAAITDAITRWVAWDVRRNSPHASPHSAPNSSPSAAKRHDLPPHGENHEPTTPELTYVRD